MYGLHYNTIWEPEAGATGFVYSSPGEDISADTVEELLSKYRKAEVPNGMLKTEAFVYRYAGRRSKQECVGRIEGDRFIPIPSGSNMISWLASIALERLKFLTMTEDVKKEHETKIRSGDFHRMSFFGDSKIGKWVERIASKLPEEPVYEQLCLFEM